MRKKKIPMLLSSAMILNAISLPVFAEENSVIQQSESGFYYIEENGDQVRLSNKSEDGFLEVDGLSVSYTHLDVYKRQIFARTFV